MSWAINLYVERCHEGRWTPLWQPAPHPDPWWRLIAARLEASDLASLLSRRAEATRGDARMRIRVEVGRTRVRTATKVIDPKKNATADTADYTTKTVYDLNHRVTAVTDARTSRFPGVTGAVS